MKLSQKTNAWLPLLFGVVMAMGMLAGYQLQRHMDWRGRQTASGTAGSLQQVMDLIRYKYVDSLSLDSIETKGIEAVVGSLDPHSVYIPARELSAVTAEMAGNFSGIGIEYQLLNDTVVVAYVVENGPSDRAGLQVGDQILQVGDSVITNRRITTEQLRGLLRGRSRSTVQLQLLRDGKPISVTIERGSIPLPSLDAAYMAAPGVAYIRLNRFAETTYREFMDAAYKLQDAGMKQMILDLRGNGGGLLEEATKIADELLPDGLTIVSTRGQHIKTREVQSTKPGIFEKGDLVVLIDEFSASASEVLAAALQDNDRATIVGRRSFGKGLVQEQFGLANGGALRLTVARYYTPTGRSIQKPYDNGSEKYHAEILNRYTNGNGGLDTASVAGRPTFTTRKGKVLYDHGGITPDVVVTADTALAHQGVAQLYRLRRLNDYLFEYYRSHRPQILDYKDPLSFAQQFEWPASTWQDLKQMAGADSLNWQGAQAWQDDMAWRMKALVARYHWRGQGYYEIVNSRDPIFQRAIQLMKTPR